MHQHHGKHQQRNRAERQPAQRIATFFRTAPLGLRAFQQCFLGGRLVLFGQFFQARHLRVALALFSLFFCARFFLRLLATFSFHCDPRFDPLFDTLTFLAFGRNACLGILLDTLALRRLVSGFTRSRFTRAHFSKRFLFSALTRLTFGFEFGLIFAVGFFAHFLLDQHPRLRLYFRLLLGLEFGLHFRFNARAICRFLARPRFESLPILCV